MPEPKDDDHDSHEIARALYDALSPEAIKAMVEQARDDHELFVRYLSGMESLAQSQVAAGKFSAEDEGVLLAFVQSFTREELVRLHNHMHYLEHQWPRLHGFVVNAILTKTAADFRNLLAKAEKAEEN